MASPGRAAADNGAMLPDRDHCYRALRTRDGRFDGRFFVGVKTTGIYCRPVCPARTPLARNCTFFPSAAAAEAGGFRPCLRCRPELAPGYATVDANRRLAQAAAGLIEDGRLEDASLAGLARDLGVTDRHLRRVFQQEFGVQPVAYAQTQRLLLAKRLLTDTSMPVLDVAMASGFASLRRFNDLFRTRYRMAPGELRKAAPAHHPADCLSFDLAFRPPYDWPAMLAFLRRRAIAGVEAVDGHRYRRSVRIARAGRILEGWMEVALSPRKSALRVTASTSLAGAIPVLLGRVKSFLDLGCRPDEIAAALGPLAVNPGIRLPGAMDGFEMGVRAILGQQVTVAAAGTLASRFARAFGDPFQAPFDGVERLFPAAPRVAAVAAADVARLGVIRTRAEAIVGLARAIDAGALRLEPSVPASEALAGLARIPGIGPWTAQYVVMRALAWPDAFPHPDAALLKAMREPVPRRALERAEAWRPWRSYAAMHLWNAPATAPERK
jgi:AraC family transcriptional regulator of adaptative response / DNA-3-methyladenine glycosylase II